jgi:hypothetical protein
LETSQFIKAVSSFLLFEFEFKFSRGGRREKIALPDYSPKTSAASRTRHSSIMLLNSNVDVFAKSNVKSAFGIPDNVDAIRHRELTKNLVAGAGFEPAAFRL